jgi:hypothetical protein
MKPFVLFIWFGLLAMPSAALAQYGPGSQSGSSTTRNLNESEAWDSLSIFGACYAAREPAKALRLVATQAGSADEAKTYKALFSNSDELCLGDVSELNFPYKYVRGAIAEGLYVKRIPVPPALAAQAIPREKVASFMDAAICCAAHNTAAAQWLIASTNPGTKKETGAMDALRPNFIACLPENMPKDLAIDMTLLRFRIAEALWRLGMVHS